MVTDKFLLIANISSLFLLLIFSPHHIQGWKNIPEEFRANGEIIMNTCVAKVGISKEIVLKARDLEYPEEGTNELELFKCYLKCMFVELGSWDDSIKAVNYIKAIEIFPDHLKNIYRINQVTCKDIRGIDDCDTAYETMNCYERTTPDKHFVI